MSEKSKYLNHVSAASGENENTPSEELFHYPTITHLFAPGESERFDAVRVNFESHQKDLDLIIRKGSNDEAKSAAKASKAVKITLELLESLKTQQ